MVLIHVLFTLLFVINFMLKGYLVWYVDTQPIFDFARYYQAAIDLADGHGFVMFGRTTAFQGVGYPGFLAFFFSMFGPSLLLAKSLNWILSLLSALLFYHIAKRFLPSGVAMLATTLYIYLPKEILYVNVLGSELLFNALMLGYLASYFKSWPEQGKRATRQWIWLIGAGLLLGCMSLVKPLSPLFGFLVVIGELGRCIGTSLAAQKGVWWKGILRTAVVAILSIAVIAPWTYRNYQVFDAFVPMTTNGGYVLYVNNNPYATGAWMDPYTIPGSPIHEVSYPESDPRFEVEMNQRLKEAAQEWIIDNPGRFMQLMLYRFYETFYTNWDWKWAFESNEPIISDQTKAVIHRVTMVMHGILASPYYLAMPVVLIGFLGTALSRRKRMKMGLGTWEKSLALVLFTIPALMITTVTMIFEGNSRYSFPCHPAFAVYAAMVPWLVTKLYKTNN
ncbi:ArnT family glycosyltransferase [Ammoniphilus sp. 3BR4]|uniref:ArnT family glycosyltransferase n=1 Tax=Ammoniphilus sp. 3BR4 TaxID=3158265 RepID=UPI0034664761